MRNLRDDIRWEVMGETFYKVGQNLAAKYNGDPPEAWGGRLEEMLPKLKSGKADIGFFFELMEGGEYYVMEVRWVDPSDKTIELEMYHGDTFVEPHVFNMGDSAEDMQDSLLRSARSYIEDPSTSGTTRNYTF